MQRHKPFKAKALSAPQQPTGLSRLSSLKLPQVQTQQQMLQLLKVLAMQVPLNLRASSLSMEKRVLRLPILRQQPILQYKTRLARAHF
jgi:hypothetical protein